MKQFMKENKRNPPYKLAENKIHQGNKINTKIKAYIESKLNESLQLQINFYLSGSH